MFRLDLRKARSIQTPDGVTLFYAQSSFRAASPFGGGGYAYSHPVAIRHDASGAMWTIRDHLMVVRLGAAFLILAAWMTRWINGR